MTKNNGRTRRHTLWMAMALTLTMTSAAWAQTPSTSKPEMTIYGFAMLDIGQNFKTINPNWFDTMRVTKLPSFDKQYGEDNSTFAGVRQTRFGAKATMPTSMGDLKTTFEFELFGVGGDEGQTTFRLRHAYGELGHFGAGQTWSPFMDPDVFPNSLEYWGPTGMVFFRNVQVRYFRDLGANSHIVLALERPGASGDQGVYADRVELGGIMPRFPMPDITGAYKYSSKWGYARVAGVYRRVAWDDVLADAFELGGSANTWGLNLSSNINVGSNDVIRLQYVFGEGVQNYMNDSPVDIGVQNNFANVVTPLLGKPVPIQGSVVFLDHKWNDKWTTSVGFSHQDNENTDGQAADAFRRGMYALGNLLYTPVPNVMMGGEFQWGRRENNSDGWQYDGYKLQFSFKYNFSHKIGG